MNRHSAPILNIEALDYQPLEAVIPGAPERFDAKLGQLGTPLGAQKLGYNITVIPPGKRAFPLHNHCANEEMFFILEGEGELRIGDSHHPVRKGDVIACPSGGPETAHQLINTSTAAELKFLAVSTKLLPEVVEYPDSGKFGVRAEFPAGPEGKKELRFRGRLGETRNYWDGES